MPMIRRQFMLAALAPFGAGAVPAQTSAPRADTRLVFALITPRAAEQTRANWAPFVDRLAGALAQPVDLRTFSDQAELVAAFKRGDVDLGWMGNGPALEVVESGAGAVFAQMVTKDGSTGFHSVLVVPADSKLGSLADALGDAKRLHFADGDPKSASGHLVPSYFAFQKNGVNDVRAIFKRVSNGSHQGNLKAVAQGEADIATANNEELQFFAKEFPALAKQVRVIWESPLIPQSPLVWKTSLAAALRRRILQFTTTFGAQPDERQVLERLNNLSGFRQSSNRQLVTVADLEMFKARQAINNDPALSAAERAKRIEATIQRGSRLDLKLKLSASSLL